MTFHWNWCSKTGSARSENQDYAGIAVHENFLISIIVDGVFSRPLSGELARDFVFLLIDRAIDLNGPPTSVDVMQWIRDAFHHFEKPRDPSSSISFLVVCFFQEKLLFSVHAGDCRVGVKNQTEEIEWKTQVHSLATAIVPLNDAELRQHPARNQLTRTFSTKRFKEPEITELNCQYHGGAILVSDGFWAEFPVADLKIYCVETWPDNAMNGDDASRLFIQWRAAEPVRAEDGDNLYVRVRSLQ